MKTTASHWHGFLPYQTWTGVLTDLNRPALDVRNITSCGIFSVHHAMVFLGQGSNFQSLRSHHRPFWQLLRHGTEAAELVAIARKQSLHAKVFSSGGIKTMRSKVDQALKAGHPVILGSEPAVHWICLGGRTADGGYVWADSASKPAVGVFGSWEEVEEWMTCDGDGNESNELEYPLEMITIAPGARMPPSRSLVPWSGAIWANLAWDESYALDWSNQLADMLDVFWDLEYAPKSRSAGDFLDEHLDTILPAVSAQLGVSSSALRSTALGYRDVADFHSLVVPTGEEAGAIAAFAIKLAGKAEE
jgi:hypothetical protein